MSPCFGMPVPPAVSCFLSRPFHSLSTGPFNGLGACRATRQRDAPPHAKCTRMGEERALARLYVPASVRSRTEAENEAREPRLVLGEQCAKAISVSDVERKKRRRRARARRGPGDRYHRASRIKRKKGKGKEKKERVNETRKGKEGKEEDVTSGRYGFFCYIVEEGERTDANDSSPLSSSSSLSFSLFLSLSLPLCDAPRISRNAENCFLACLDAATCCNIVRRIVRPHRYGRIDLSSRFDIRCSSRGPKIRSVD